MNNQPINNCTHCVKDDINIPHIRNYPKIPLEKRKKVLQTYGPQDARIMSQSSYQKYNFRGSERDGESELPHSHFVAKYMPLEYGCHMAFNLPTKTKLTEILKNNGYNVPTKINYKMYKNIHGQTTPIDCAKPVILAVYTVKPENSYEKKFQTASTAILNAPLSKSAIWQVINLQGQPHPHQPFGPDALIEYQSSGHLNC